MTSKLSRPVLAAVAAAGASGLVATSAQAAVSIPTSLVNQPLTTGAILLTPESALLTGVVDTGGSTQSTFQLAPNTTLSWDGGSLNLVNTGKSPITEYVDGIPTNNTTTGVYNTIGGASGTASYPISNGGADNNSSVLFEYDSYKDFVAHGYALGPQTVIAPEVDVPTVAAGLSQVAQGVGGTQMQSQLTGNTPLTPNTKYVYEIVQQAGVTDAAETINTAVAQGSSTPTVASSKSVNPTWTCYPLTFIQQTAPYNQYTSTGTVSGGTTSSGTAQTTPQPQIQGPCIYIYGGGSNYYQSAPQTFTTPKLGSVKFSNPSVKKNKLTLTVTDNSIVPAVGKLFLKVGRSTVASGRINVKSFSVKNYTFNLTGAGKKDIKNATKKVNAKVSFTSSNDQPSATKSIKF